MGWIFDWREPLESQLWQLKTLNGSILFEGSQNECKHYYKDNIFFLYVTRKLKYIFKSDITTGKAYKIDLGAVYENHKQDLF